MLALDVGLALTLATLVPSPLVATPLFGEETAHLFQLLSPAFTIAAIGIVPLAMLERRLDFRRISMIEIATVLVGSAASVALAVLGLEAEAYVLGFVIGLIVWAMLLVIVGPRRCRDGTGASCARSRASASPPGSPASRWSATATSIT